jgi:hypothetical protein
MEVDMEMNEVISQPTRLSDDDLVTAVKRLVEGHRKATAVLIAHLMEFDDRRLYLAEACRSMFVYCTEVLRLSEHEAYHRIEAARLARKFPVVLRMLAEGALNLTTAGLLSPHLTTQNHESLLAAAAGRSKREVEVLLAKAFPRPVVPSSLRKVPVRRPESHSLLGTDAGSAGRPQETLGDATPAVAVGPVDAPAATLASSLPPPGIPDAVSLLLPQPKAASKRRELVRPLDADRYELRVTVSAATRDKLRQATDLLRHAVPDGDAAQIIDRALTTLLEDLAKKKFAATARPRPAAIAPSRTRHVPAHVKRAVWRRDGGRCAFVGGGARRCRERGDLEFHHLRPYGAGGDTTVENIALRCRAHNGYEAELFYGQRFTPAAKRRVEVQLGPDRVGEATGSKGGTAAEARKGGASTTT